ncbi:MAG TPA: hypothetical protein VN429_07270 [Methanospirillum sp.]|uniref:hypothetical protein n=1 Tax=Methanospirillum sp. TaxID=45200 RepID=UPI002B8CE84F|nr:hypothetical protein [Methanospirillum sp.]HWQ64200.1 hypothetical protein [Methanospirillum sp.]
MIERQEQTALLILCLVFLSCAVFTWIGEGVGKGPFAQNYTSQSPEGVLVSHQGIVQKVTATATSGNLILDMGDVSVFISSSAAGMTNVSKGDFIQVYGIVQIWKGKREILVKDSGDITIVAVSQGKNLRS